MSHCAVCLQSFQCNKCIIKDLQKKYNDLKQAFDFILDISPESLNIGCNTKVRLHSFFNRSSEPIEYDLSVDLNTAYFFTLTFDPQRFGVTNHDKSQKDYMLSIIMDIFDKQMATSCYGCFEHHKNGSIHTHLILKTYIPQEVKKYFKSKLTYNAHNKHAVDFGHAKNPQAKQYIEKEATDYYSFVSGSMTDSNDLDYIAP